MRNKRQPSFEGLEWKVFTTHFKVDHPGSTTSGTVLYQERDAGVIFIPRHGTDIKDRNCFAVAADHVLLGDNRYDPSRTQYAANLIAAKMLGANVVIGTSAVGSLNEDIHVEDLVIPDDYIDESNRYDNVFGKGIIVHANPIPAFSISLRDVLEGAAYEHAKAFNHIHMTGTYICIPGDRFGTGAEGFKRAEYAHIVGMTLCPKAAIAIQLNMHYACAAFVVDNNYDANHSSGTLEVMHRLSQPESVPAFMETAIEKAKIFAEDPGPVYQLKGNVIPGNTNRIINPHLRKIAKELIKQYCE